MVIIDEIRLVGLHTYSMINLYNIHWQMPSVWFIANRCDVNWLWRAFTVLCQYT